MMLPLLPSRTKKVPRIEARMQTPPIASGINMPAVGSMAVWMVARSIVATSVTA